jgi:hypothetical protein
MTDPISIKNSSIRATCGEIPNLSKLKVTILRNKSKNKTGMNKTNRARSKQPTGKKNI